MFGSDDEVFAPCDRSRSPSQPRLKTGNKDSGGRRPQSKRENNGARQHMNSRENDTAQRRTRTSGRDLPPLHSIHKGSVVSVQNYGAFIRLGDGSQYKDGLLHVSKMSSQRVEAVEDVLSSGDTVWVKVVEVRTEEAKYSLDMRYVGQKDGEDHDPNNIQVTDAGAGRRPGAPEPIRIGAVQATTCSRCGARGHAARECFAGTGVQYELVEEPPDEGPPIRDKGAAAKAREMEKELRRRLKRKAPSSSSCSSSSSSSLPSSAIRKYLKKRKAKKELKASAGIAEGNEAKSKKKKKKKKESKKENKKKAKELKNKKDKKVKQKDKRDAAEDEACEGSNGEGMR